MPSVREHVSAANEPDDLRPVLDAVQADLSALRTAVVGLTAKLDADAGITDTDYAATLDPAANQTTI